MSNLIGFLQQFELNNTCLSEKKKVKSESVTRSKKHQPAKKKNIINIFWFYYICNYGDEFSKCLELETKEKFKLIELVRNNKANLKVLKIKRSEFEEDILYSKQISLSTLRVLCYYNKLSIIIIKNKCYYWFDYGDQTNVWNNGTYKLNISQKDINHIKDNYFFLERTDKLLYAESHYKLKELQEISDKIGLNRNELKLKHDLYMAIHKKLSEMI